MSSITKVTSKSAGGKSSSKTKMDRPEAAPVSKVDTSGAPKSNTATPSVVETLSPVVVSNELRKKEFFDLVVERSGKKKTSSLWSKLCWLCWVMPLQSSGKWICNPWASCACSAARNCQTVARSC